MTVSAHNPDQTIPSLRQVIAQRRQRIGLQVGSWRVGTPSCGVTGIAGLRLCPWCAHQQEAGAATCASVAFKFIECATVTLRIETQAGPIALRNR